MVLGVDPGLTTGWALQFNNELMEWGHLKFDEIIPALINTDNTWDHVILHAVVIEDFALLGGKALAQTGSKFETCQVIGMFKLWAAQRGVPVHMQPPTIKPIASKHSGIKVPSNHSLSHKYDAQLHAIYYLRSEGQYRTLLEREGLK